MHRRSMVCALLVLLLALAGCAPRTPAPASADAESSEPLVGGGCEYTSHKGIATIVRVEQTAASKAQATVAGGAGYAGYEVWFTFQTDSRFDQGWVTKALAKEHLLTMDNSWYVGEGFMEEYGIAPNARLACTVRVMTKGTCTPLIFAFDEVDTGDYFESQ